jgi:hypothetical protein
MALQEYASPEAIVRNPDVFYKVGITQSNDAEERFSPKYHNLYGFKGRCLGLDYTVECKWSTYIPKTVADLAELQWKNKFPKNLWVDEVEGEQYNGITECRYMDEEKYIKALQYYYGTYKKGKYPYSKENWKLYLVKFTKIK